MSADGFDAYQAWLGIPPREQPPDHYRLLGLRRFETDRGVIEDAADDRMQIVHQHKSGPHAETSRKLLSELAAAKVCLCDPQRKAAYDRGLSGSPESFPVSIANTAQAATPGVWKPAPLRLDDAPTRAAGDGVTASYAAPQPYATPSTYATPEPYATPLMYGAPTAPVAPAIPAAPANASAPAIPVGIPVAQAVPVARAIPAATAVEMAASSEPDDDFSVVGTGLSERGASRLRRRRGPRAFGAIFLIFQIILGGVIGTAAGFVVLTKIRTGEWKLPTWPLNTNFETSPGATGEATSQATPATTPRSQAILP
ncbi:MAG TPA: hypothetical protein VGE52_18695 [Pirellulales bacterium]